MGFNEYGLPVFCVNERAYNESRRIQAFSILLPLYFVPGMC
jgi:hypothetical protein